MKRVVVLIRSLANGGAEKQALLVALSLRSSCDVRVLVVSAEPCFQRHLDFAVEKGLQVEFLRRNPVLGLPALARRLRRERVDVLFTFLPSDTLLGAVAGRLAGVPLIVGGLRNTGLQTHKFLVLRFLHNHVLDATISNSRAAALHFERRGFAGSKLRVVPNGIEAPPVAEQEERRGVDGRLTVLTVARFVPNKDLRTALRAVARAKRELAGSFELSYELVGHGPLEQDLRSWIVEEGLEAEVSLVIDPPSVEALFARADVYLASSRHEGLSNSILEAMSHGLPVVATKAGDSELLVGAGGILAEPGDAAALGDGLVRLARDEAARLAMGALARRRVLEGYSVEALGDAYRSIVEHGVASRPEPRRELPEPGGPGSP